MSQDRTEKATPKKREDARRKGQIARGAELSGALAFLSGLFVLNIFSGDISARAGNLFAETMMRAADKPELAAADVHLLFLEAGKTLALLILPILAVVLAATIAGNFAQGGLAFSAEALKPNGNRLNPAKNIKKIFGADSLVGLLKTALKLVVLGAISYSVLAPIVTDSASLVNAPIPTVMVRLGEIFYALALRTGLVLLIFAFADYGYAWYKHEKSLKMTKQEIKEEFKSQEGDPLVKSQRRRAARELTQRRSLTDVPKATVVITNPTHFAVALRYDREKDAAPIVVAKGVDALAAKIRHIAGENDVPLMENPPLARALYRTADIGQTVPTEFFSAVAEILAYVYRQKQK